MILEINVEIWAVSLTDGAFSMIITTVLHTVSLTSSPAIALHHFSSPPWGYYHANLKDKKKYISVNNDI